MKSKIDQFFELEAYIWSLVGCDEVHYSGLEDARDSSFFINKREVLYGTLGDKDSYYGGDLYSRAVFRGKDYTIVVYDNGCGGRTTVLFDNTKEVEEEAFEDRYE